MRTYNLTLRTLSPLLPQQRSVACRPNTEEALTPAQGLPSPDPRISTSPLPLLPRTPCFRVCPWPRKSLAPRRRAASSFLARFEERKFSNQRVITAQPALRIGGS